MSGELEAALASLKVKYAAAASAAGPTYNIDGQSVNRMEYLAGLAEQIKACRDLIATGDDGAPVEFETHGMI